MDRHAAERFAAQWIDDWCRRDIDAIVGHYAPDASFTSPVAARRTGTAEVQGVDALRAYWRGALAYDSFRFELQSWFWDDVARALTIIYTRHIDGRSDRACELLIFDTEGRVVRGEAMYGAALEAAAPPAG